MAIMKNPLTIDAIDALLPQTQCGLCNYKGCRPYAKAIIEERANINQCPPGGIETLLELAHQLTIDPTPFLQDMQIKAKPFAVAAIREDECIGCTKCIQACPTDAILGTHKKMHTILTDACTGCGLCITPCPVDCIDMIPIATPPKEQKQQQAKQWRRRYLERNARLAKAKQVEIARNEQPSFAEQSNSARKLAVAAAIQRAKAKKSKE